MQIVVKTLRGNTHILDVEQTETVANIKAKIQKLEGIPFSEQQLCLQGKKLEDASSLSTVGTTSKKVTLLLISSATNCSGVPTAVSSTLVVQDSSVKCASGCGFFGHTSTVGLCSRCYALKKREVAFNQCKEEEEDEEDDEEEYDEEDETDEETESDVSSSTVDNTLRSSPSIVNTSNDYSRILASSAFKRKREEASTFSFLESNGKAAAEELLLSEPVAKEQRLTERKAKNFSNHCEQCNKKIGLTAVKCRCGGLFCAYHRYSDRHECTVDYRKLAKESIAKANPQVIATKVQKL